MQELRAAGELKLQCKFETYRTLQQAFRPYADRHRQIWLDSTTKAPKHVTTLRTTGCEGLMAVEVIATSKWMHCWKKAITNSVDPSGAQENAFCTQNKTRYRGIINNKQTQHAAHGSHHNAAQDRTIQHHPDLTCRYSLSAPWSAT